MAKGGSKTLTGILCFIFGFIFALIAEVAVIAAGVYFLLKADLDSVLNTVGIENTDEDGNKIYINTNEVKTLSDLIISLKDISSSGTESLTIGTFENIFPVAGSIVDKVYGALANALSEYGITETDIREIVDEDELKSTPISELGTFLSDCFYSAEISLVLRIAGIDPEENVLFMVIAYGQEASVILNGDGTATVLYKDNYTLSDGKYVRQDGVILPSSCEAYLVAEPNGADYSLYYYVGDYYSYIAQQSEDGTFSVTQTVYTVYDSDVAEISGAYYYLNDQLVILSARTIGDVLSDEDGILSVFRDVYINDIITDWEVKADDLFVQMFEGLTVGDLLDGKIIFADLLDKIYIPDLISINPEDFLLMYMGYSVTDVQAATGTDYAYTGVIHFYAQNSTGDWVANGTADCFIETDESGSVSRVYYMEDGEQVDCKGVRVPEINAQIENIIYTLRVRDIISIDPEDKLMVKLGEYYLSDISDALDDLLVSDFISDVSPEDSLLAYMVYGITDIQSATGSSGYDYTAKYHLLTESGTQTVDAYVVVSGGVIAEVYYFDNGVKTDAGTHINRVNDRISGLMSDLKIGEIIEIDESNAVLYALRNSTINSLAEDINSLSIQQLFASEIYGQTSPYSVSESNFDSSFLYYTMTSEGEFVLAGNNGHLDSFAGAEGQTLYTYGKPEGVWSLLLYNNSGYEEVYTVNEVADMQTNVLYNLQHSTLFELYYMGIVGDGTEEDDVWETLCKQYSGSSLGNLTISEFIGVVGNIIG